MMEREVWVSRLEARRRGQRFLGEVEKGRGCLGRRKMRWRSEGRKPGKNRAIRTQRNEEKKMLRFNDAKGEGGGGGHKLLSFTSWWWNRGINVGFGRAMDGTTTTNA
ncbi:hypothetical protein D5086_014717 [Populus alba]|uniref:Uncharacterized protein n=1 Tax=Populus alba TaxID=43335 RepID=A0ACC4C041_POPAL